MLKTLKRKHHYIWRKYLKAWATNNQVWCMRGSEVFCSELMGIGQKRDFYKLKNLEPEDIHFLELMLSKSNPRLKLINERWVEFFRLMTSVNSLKPKVEKNHEEFHKSVQEIIHNTEEDLYSKIEADSVEYLDSLLRHEFDFLGTKSGRLGFLHYLCSQYFRTSNMQQRMINAAKLPVLLGTPNMENCWAILRHIWAGNVAFSLAVDESYNIYITQNISHIPLITGDQPVINTYAIGKPENEPVSEIELYYPISPKLAIVVSNNNKWVNKSQLHIDDVENFNKAIVAASSEQIYSNDKATLALFS